MRRQSLKTAALYRKHKAERQGFIFEYGSCWICGSVTGLCVDEICMGPNRLRAFPHREAWLCTCALCNCNVTTDTARWTLPLKLALKLDNDPAHFSIAKINEILAPDGHPNPPQRVTAAEVLDALIILKTKGRLAA